MAMIAGLSSLGTGVQSLHLRRPILGLFCQCRPGMRMVLSLVCHSRFSFFCPNFKKWCWGGRSLTLSVPVIHRFAVRSMRSPLPPLVASPTASVSDLAMVALGSPRLAVVLVESLTSEEPTSEAREAPILVTPGAHGAS
jgi:hypothetical protein